MTLKELFDTGEFTLLTPDAPTDRPITGGICCDLLSWVMARGSAGMAWITVQTHMNVVAVASLHEFACILLAEGCAMPPDVLKKAADEGIAVLSSPRSGYELSGMLCALGIGK